MWRLNHRFDGQIPVHDSGGGRRYSPGAPDTRAGKTSRPIRGPLPDHRFLSFEFCQFGLSKDESLDAVQVRIAEQSPLARLANDGISGALRGVRARADADGNGVVQRIVRRDL